MAGSGTAAAGLLILASMLATRAARSSTTAALDGGAEDLAGNTAGHPSIQPTQITSEAATAPDMAAMTQGEIAGAGSRDVGSVCMPSGGCTRSPAFPVYTDSSHGLS